MEVTAITTRTGSSLAQQPREVKRTDWSHYFMEAGCLGLFMLAAGLFGVLLEYPNSVVHQALPDTFTRTLLMGVAMGVTLILIVHTPWGKQSGAHMNPAVTLTYLSLGKVSPARALFYVLAQFVGGISGIALAFLIAGPPLGHYRVNFVATQPGETGGAVAFAAEMLISLLMMSTVLWSTNSKRFSRWTPFLAGSLVALFITFESPLSGMSMNPARTLASALAAHQWTALWIYFSAPFAGMLLAASLYRMGPGTQRVYCAKLHHHNNRRCLFNCRYGELHVE